MLSEKIHKMLNDQVNLEFSSAFVYLSMATYFDDKNLSGFAHWMKVQYEEEVKHARKIMGYIEDRLAKVDLKTMEVTKTAWASPLDAFKDAFAHEQHVTKSINAIVTAAMAEHDHATVTFLNWFVDEQVEEEKSTDEVVQKLIMIGEGKHGLYMLDREMARRED